MAMPTFPGTSCKGQLLVAAPPLTDPNFDRTVVYMLDHTTDGAVGVVLNRPVDDELPDEVAEWQSLVTAPDRLFYGGPVESHALIALARTSSPLPTPKERSTEPLDEPADEAADEAADDGDDPGWADIGGGLLSIDLSHSPYAIEPTITHLRVFRGYSGWDPMQLDAELGQDAWIVVPAEPDDLFHPSPEGLWRDVLARQGGRTALLAKAPDDLELN